MNESCYICDSKKIVDPITEPNEYKLHKMKKEKLCEGHKEVVNYYIEHPKELIKKNDDLLDNLRRLRKQI